MLFGTVGIYGVGLLGGSLGMALKRRSLSDRVIGIGRNEERLRLALDSNAVDEVSLDLASVSPRLDYLIVATPVSLIPACIAKASPNLKSGAIVTDVGSTKSLVVAQSQAALVRQNVFFVGSHPMAGGEKTGVQAAREDLFEKAICFVTPTPQSNLAARDQVIKLWQSVGMEVHVVPPDIHDQLVAASSHLPHLLASALTLFAREKDAQLEKFRNAVGPGFRDTTRIAAGSEEIWKDIFAQNRVNLLNSLSELKAILDRFSEALSAEDDETLEEWLREAREFRQSL